MSDDTQNDEIDEVLSSVRELVSYNGKAQGHLSDVGDLNGPADGHDRLVLTPAFRVPEPSEPGRDDVLVLDAAKRADAAPVVEEPSAAEGGAPTPMAEESAAVPDDHEPEIGDPDDTRADEAFDVQGLEMAAAEPPLMDAPDPDPAPPTAEIDPEVLRDTIREVIREELSGDLDTDMAQGLRKLVRREINEILTRLDLD